MKILLAILLLTVAQHATPEEHTIMGFIEVVIEGYDSPQLFILIDGDGKHIAVKPGDINTDEAGRILSHLAPEHQYGRITLSCNKDLST